jgi:hypothetical protein
MELFLVSAAIVLVVVVLIVRSKMPGIGRKPLELRTGVTVTKETHLLPPGSLDLIKSDRRAEAIAMISKETGLNEAESTRLYDEVRTKLKDQGKA